MGKIQEIRDRYDAEHDVIQNPDGSFLQVTWAEMALLEMCEKQQETIERLERKLEAHIKRQSAYEFEGV